MQPTITRWSNRQGSRDRQAVAIIVTEDGAAVPFVGSAIPGVCAVAREGYTKNGKWSYTTFAVSHRPTTAFVSWSEDWDTGEVWPQTSWEAGFAWLAAKAPGLSMAGFDRAIRAHWPKTAGRWDAAAKAVDEFAVALPLEHAAETATRLATHAERVAALKAQTEQTRREAEELRRANDELECATRALQQERHRKACLAAEKAEQDRLNAPLAHNPFASLKL